MTDKDRQKRIEKAQMRVVFTMPFFAPGVAKLPVRFVPPGTLDTAATDGREIIWNQEWFDKLEDRHIVTVLCHEVCHCMLGHNWRAPLGADWDVWNQATDHAVNLMLKEFGEQVTSKGLSDPFPFPDPQDSYCADPAFKGMAEEVIYSKIPKGKKGGKGGKGGKGSMPSFGQIIQPGQPDPNGQPGGQGQQPGQGPPGPGQPGQQGPSDPKQLASDWRNTLQQSIMAAKGRGNLPGAWVDKVEGLLNPKVPWWELVRNWLREKAADDWTWSKPNKFYDESGFILPSLENEKVGTMVMAKDTSGSIDMEIARHFVSEQQHALDDLRPTKLIDICCDTKIQSVKEYTPGDTVSMEFPGRGGTDFRPIFEHIEGLAEVPKCLVVLTDLDGSFPDQDPGFPVLWVTWDQHGSAPFGEIIRV